MSADTIFQIVNSVALIGWLVLLSSWKWPSFARLVSGAAIPLLLALAYVVLFAAYFGRFGEGGFGSLPELTALFGVPELVLVGWIHYLAFDLFIGAWQVRTARDEQIPFLLVVPCLVFTFLAGPLGLLMFSGLRFARVRRVGV